MPQDAPSLASPTPEQRRVAAGQFERANQVVAGGDYEYGIGLLLSCCKLDPGNLIYRQALRRTQKLKFKNNLRGSWLAWLLTLRPRTRLKRAMMKEEYLFALEQAELVLNKNPWDVGVQMAMAQAAEELGLLDLGVWTLEQARQKSPEDPRLNRTLAKLYEKRGNFAQAIALWELVYKVNPDDHEAKSKAKDLAARDTIARGHYQSSSSSPGKSGRMSRKETPDREDEDYAGPSSSRRTESPKPKRKAAPAPPPEEPEEPGIDKRIAREVAALKKRIEADPTVAATYMQLVALLRAHGHVDQAKAILSKGLPATGNNFEVAAELADLEIEPFRQNLAITEERIRENPDDELRRIRVRLLKEINTRELDLYRMKAERFPADMSHRFELGVRLLRAGQVDEAIKELQAARTDPKLFWKSLLYLGHCFKGRNNWKLARRNFDEALHNVPASEEAPRKELYFQLASGCAEANELQDAVNYASELANLDWSYRDIGTLLEEWQQRLNDSQK